MDEIIRVAAIDEIGAIADLWILMCKELNPQAKPDKQAWIQIIHGLYKTGKYHIVVAEADGQLVGFVDGFVYLEPASGELTGISQHIYILPKYRMSIVALRLYERIVHLVNGDGATTIQITSDLSTVRMWKRKGFVVKNFIMSKKVEV